MRNFRPQSTIQMCTQSQIKNGPASTVSGFDQLETSYCVPKHKLKLHISSREERGGKIVYLEK